MWQKVDILQRGHVHPRNHQPIIPPSGDWDRVRRMNTTPLDVAFFPTESCFISGFGLAVGVSKVADAVGTLLILLCKRIRFAAVMTFHFIT